MDMTQDTSSPAYFEKTFGVDAAKAADLSSQAKFLDRTRGGGIMAEAPVVAPATSSAPALNVQAEYDALMKDRADGKMTNAQWNSTGANRAHELAEVIANGGGAQPAPLVRPAAQTHLDAMFAPPANAYEYRLPDRPSTAPPEQLAQDRQLIDAFHGAQLPAYIANSIIRHDTEAVANAIANETDVQRESRHSGNLSRLTTMWGGKENYEQNSKTIVAYMEQEFAKPHGAALRAFVQRNDEAFTPDDLDSILQFAKYRAGKR